MQIPNIFGGFVMTYLISYLVEWAVLKRVLNNPVTGKLASVAFAFVALMALAIATSYGTDAFWYNVAALVVAAIAIGAYKYNRGVDLQIEQESACAPGEADSLTETFR